MEKLTTERVREDVADLECDDWDIITEPFGPVRHHECTGETKFDVWLAEVLAEAWDAGHQYPWKRGPDDCRCGAWSSNECACGLYGTGPLVSLADNPHRKGTRHE